MTPEEAQALQLEYLKQRRKWLRKIKWPWAGYETPDPGEIDLVDDTEG